MMIMIVMMMMIMVMIEIGAPYFKTHPFLTTKILALLGKVPCHPMLSALAANFPVSPSQITLLTDSMAMTREGPSLVRKTHR